jgi:hypothetical protein
MAQARAGGMGGQPSATNMHGQPPPPHPTTARKPKKPREQINAELRDDGTIAQLALKPLCKCGPEMTCGHLTPSEKHDLITKARKARMQIGNRKDKSTLMAAIGANAEFRGGKITFPGSFFVAGRALCVDAYRLVMGWTNRSWYNARHNRALMHPHPHPNPHTNPHPQ